MAMRLKPSSKQSVPNPQVPLNLTISHKTSRFKDVEVFDQGPDLDPQGYITCG